MFGRRKHQEAAAGWPASRDSRRRVLIENADGSIQTAAERILREAGYDVALCGGVETHRNRRCPLVETGECDLTGGADVIVHSLNVSGPGATDVLRALRKEHPTTPVVVEISAQRLVQLASELEGCFVVPAPVTEQRLLESVEAALAGAEPPPVGAPS